jgi:hypothetical protein
MSKLYVKGKKLKDVYEKEIVRNGNFSELNVDYSRPFSIVSICWKGHSYYESLSGIDKKTGKNVNGEDVIKNFVEMLYNDIFYLVDNHNYTPIIDEIFANDCETNIDNFFFKIRNNIPVNYTEKMSVIGNLYYLKNYIDKTNIKFYWKFYDDNVFKIINKEPLFICNGCSKTTCEKMLKCGACKTNKVFYCSISCQKDDWKKHKKVCEKFN